MKLTAEEARRLVRIGTSGYVYPHWKKVFYPEGLPQKQQFAFYARFFDTVELNNTFYMLPKEPAVRRWAEQTPPGFVYAVKGSRFLTHMKKLNDTGEGREKFFRAIEPLRPHVGPVLWQLPPNWKKDLPRLSAFFETMPGDYEHAVEFREASWYADEVYEALNDLGVALCIHNMPPLPKTLPFPPPGPFYYRRFHGVRGKYGGLWGRKRLLEPAAEIALLARHGIRCFAYFNNDEQGHAVTDALMLKALVDEAIVRDVHALELHLGG